MADCTDQACFRSVDRAACKALRGPSAWFTSSRKSDRPALRPASTILASWDVPLKPRHARRRRVLDLEPGLGPAGPIRALAVFGDDAFQPLPCFPRSIAARHIKTRAETGTKAALMGLASLGSVGHHRAPTPKLCDQKGQKQRCRQGQANRRAVRACAPSSGPRESHVNHLCHTPRMSPPLDFSNCCDPAETLHNTAHCCISATVASGRIG
jgi:hypothetical protein